MDTYTDSNIDANSTDMNTDRNRDKINTVCNPESNREKVTDTWSNRHKVTYQVSQNISK